jgi:hypothetical protein
MSSGRVQTRSRLSNGYLLPRGVVSTGTWVRRWSDVIDLLQSDAGGSDTLPEAMKSLIRRAATIQVICERFEAEFAESETGGTSAQWGEYQRLSDTLRRLLETVGLERKSKDVTPTVAEWRANHARRVIEGD